MEPRARIEAYFADCGHGTPEGIADHFTPDAVIYDTNIAPMRTAIGIGRAWVKVRNRWGGAEWTVDSFVGDADGAAIEWSMTGTEPDTDRGFVFRGSEHYRFAGEENLIDEIRQYWTFDPAKLDTALRDYDHPGSD